MAEFDLPQIDRLLTTTRSVRKRLDLKRPVEPEVIQECIRIAIQAPTGGGYAEQWRWLVVTDPVKRARLAELYRATLRANGPYEAEQVRRQFGAHIARTIDSGVYLADRLQDVPVHVIPCVRRSPSESDIFEVATMFGSILPAVWSFQLALRARGLGTVLTTMHLPHEKEVAALLDIPDNVIQVGLIPVAYYTGRDFRPAVRRPAEEITHWNTWEVTTTWDGASRHMAEPKTAIENTVPLTIGPQLQEFFAQQLLATVCTLNSRSAPEMTPIWYEYFDGFIWFNGTATREWLTRMESTRRATFFLLDRENNWKWAQVWGRVVEVGDDADAMAFKRLGRRYDHTIGHVEGRRYVKLEITSVKGHAGSPTEMWDVHA